MLTQISNDLIQHFLHKSNVNEYLKSPKMKKLYESLNNHHTNSQIRMRQGFNEYPLNSFKPYAELSISQGFFSPFLFVSLFSPLFYKKADRLQLISYLIIWFYIILNFII